MQPAEIHRRRSMREPDGERVNAPAKRQPKTTSNAKRKGPKRNGIHRRRNKKIAW